MAAFSSTVTIEELDADGSTGRVLKLQGAGLPFQGASWKGDNNMTTTWYPGNGASATQQVFGPREMPSTWTGVWRQTMLLRSNCTFTDANGVETQIVLPRTLRDIAESMFRGGLQLRVIWATQVADAVSGSAVSVDTSASDYNDTVTRTGRCKSWDFPHDRVTDIHWTFEFHWNGRGDAAQVPVSTRDDSLSSKLSAASTSLGALQAQLRSIFNSSNPSIPLSASTFSLGQLEQIAAYPQQLQAAFNQSAQRIVTDIDSLKKILTTVQALPSTLQQGAVSLSQDLLGASLSLVRTIGVLPAETGSNVSRPSSVVRANNYLQQTGEVAESAAAQAIDLSVAFRALFASSGLKSVLGRRTVSGTTTDRILSLYTTRAGDTPQKISMRFYGNPDHDADVLSANQLPIFQTAFEPGTKLLIPVLSTSTSTATG